VVYGLGRNRWDH